MPAVVKRSVGSPSGTSGDDATCVCPRAVKKSRNDRRRSLAVRIMGSLSMGSRTLDWPASYQVRPEKWRTGIFRKHRDLALATPPPSGREPAYTGPSAGDSHDPRLLGALRSTRNDRSPVISRDGYVLISYTTPSLTHCLP